MIDRHYLEDSVLQLNKLKSLADKAIGQTDDEHLFATLDPEANSIAIIMKHVAGNMRSRWTDFLTSDGEKPDRDRDREFVVESGDTRANILSMWEEGWRRVFHAVSSLRPEDLGTTITIRGEPHSAQQALLRALSHATYHIGQILYLVRVLKPDSTWLTIAPGASRTHKASYRSGSQ